jgi:hypothetical protein
MRKYPKVRAVGHRDIANLLVGPVIVQEKVDGSNFSFGRDHLGGLFAWSRTQDLSLGQPDKMFAAGIDHVLSIADRIPAGFTFRCEYLKSPKHNVLAYDRVPKNHLVLFGVEKVAGGNPDIWHPYGDDDIMLSWAESLQIDLVPELFYGQQLDLNTTWAEAVAKWLDTESFLGGQKVEGVVVKNYTQTDERSGASYLVGKIVRPEFKEVHAHQVKLDKPDPVSSIGARYGGPARWQKALATLRDEGELVNGMEDIPKLMRRVQIDVEAEEIDSIKEALYLLYRKNVIGCTTRGLAEWYKNRDHTPVIIFVMVCIAIVLGLGSLQYWAFKSCLKKALKTPDTLVIEGCEYLAFDLPGNSFAIAHKGNCKNHDL